MEIYKIVGITFGEFNGKKWASLKLLKPIGRDFGFGFSPVEKEKCKIIYDVASEIISNWGLYENQMVYIGCNLRGRIDRVDLAE